MALDLAALDAELDAPEPPKKGKGIDFAALDAELDAPPPEPPKVRGPQRDSFTGPAIDPEEAPDLTRPAGAMGRTIRATPRAAPASTMSWDDVGSAALDALQA